MNAILLTSTLIFLALAKVSSQFIVKNLVSHDRCPGDAKLFIDDKETIYASCYDGGIISLNLTTGDITTLANNSQCNNPSSIIVHAGTVYATCEKNNNHYGVIKMSNGTTTYLSTEGCGGPCDIFVNHDVYVACDGGAAVKINKSGMATTFITREQCIRTSSIIGNTNTDVIYAGCVDSPQSIIRVNGNEIRNATHSSCEGPSSLFVDDNTGDVYAACYFDSHNGVIKINPKGNVTILATNDQCKFAVDVFVDTVSNIVYAACDNGIISIKNGVNTILATRNQCSNPNSIFVGKDKNVIYAACTYPHDGFIISITVSPPTSDDSPSYEKIFGIAFGAAGCAVLLLLLSICCIIRRNRNIGAEKEKLIQP
jgi:hypothetical protein